MEVHDFFRLTISFYTTLFKLKKKSHSMQNSVFAVVGRLLRLLLLAIVILAL